MGIPNSVGSKHKNYLAQPTRIKIEVLDLETNTKTSYDSIRAAARALNIAQTRFSMYFSRNQKKPLNGRYICKKMD